MKARGILGKQDSKDEVSQVRIDETDAEVDWDKRPRLTLRHLHRLRLINDLEMLEAEQHQKFVARMYGGNFEESGDRPWSPPSLRSGAPKRVQIGNPADL